MSISQGLEADRPPWRTGLLRGEVIETACDVVLTSGTPIARLPSALSRSARL